MGGKSKVQIGIKLAPGAVMPTKAHEHDAGFDLYARDVNTHGGDPQLWIIEPGQSAAITTGVLPERSTTEFLGRRNYGPVTRRTG